jgi:hypothetical protein
MEEPRKSKLGSRTNRVLALFTVKPSHVISCCIAVSAVDPFPGRQIIDDVGVEWLAVAEHFPGQEEAIVHVL